MQRHLPAPVLALAGALALVPAATCAQAPPAELASASLTVRSAVQPRFPLSLRGTGHSDGHAIVALTIDATGRVADLVTLEASHAAFAREAEHAVARWQFEPVSATTRPPRDVVQFEFRSAGVVDTLTHAEGAARGMAAPPLNPALRTVRWDELSAPPQVLAAPPPRLRSAALARLSGRPLIVSFIIDTEGAVHVPVIDAAADEEAASAVLEAVRAWRFTPPRHADRPVLVQAHRAFGGGRTGSLQ
jgi:TonB family protein